MPPGVRLRGGAERGGGPGGPMTDHGRATSHRAARPQADDERKIVRAIVADLKRSPSSAKGDALYHAIQLSPPARRRGHGAATGKAW